MESRGRIKSALNHEATDRIPIDFGGSPVTGIHALVIKKLRDYFQLEPKPVKVIEPYQPSMLGVNCTPTTMITDALKELQKHTEIPLSGYGNIGHTDDIEGWENTDDLTPSEYGDLAKEWQALKLKMIGGCCGTSPDHIKAIYKIVHNP